MADPLAASPGPAPGPAAQAPSAGPVFVLAPWGRRAKAYLIDLAIVFVPVMAVWALLLPPLFARAGDDAQLQQDLDVIVDASSDALPLGRFVYWALVITAVAVAAYWVIIGLYSAVFAWRTGGQTPGRRAAGIRLMRVDGRPVGFWWAFYRTFVIRELLFGAGSILSGGLLQLAQYLWPLGDDQRRTLHDMVSRSRVVMDAGDAR